MANILKVTTPPSQSYENSPRGNPTQIGNTNVKNIVDPSKITRSDNRTDFEDTSRNGLAPSYESNFGKFIQSLRNAPDIMSILPGMFQGRMETIVTSGISEGFATEIAQYMDMLKMNEAEFSSFLKNHLENAAGFKNMFFGVLRDFMASDASSEFKSAILVFLKKYNDLTSTQRILGSISQNLTNILRSMPKSEAAELEAIIKSLDLSATPGDTAKNAALLKEEIVPRIARYISRYHDFGPVRDFVTHLTLDIARYENSSREDALAALKTLSGFNSFRNRLGSIDDAVLSGLLDRLVQDKAAMKMPDSDLLLSIMQRGLAGEAGYENKLVFQNVLQSMLINSSVYMPLLHVLMPVEFAGKFMFSEIWVDPDDRSRRQGDEESRALKLLLKFDIENLGFFDMVVHMQGKALDLQLYYPEKLEGFQREIQKKLTEIIQLNGLDSKNLSMAKSRKRLTVSEVFPKIMERRNNINVTI